MGDSVTREQTITLDGTFSLAAAASFGFGPNTGRPRPDGNSMSLAFVADDLVHHAAAHLTQDAGGMLHCSVFGDADPVGVVDQVRRVLSLDQSGSAWAEVGGRDPVIARAWSRSASTACTRSPEPLWRAGSTRRGCLR
ncbi:MAG: hypothetical protein ACYDCS_03875 [Candidatus Dormibacteria bacterium]